MRYDKGIILPIIGLICLIANKLTGIVIGEDIQEQMADAVIYVASVSVVLWGIIKNHKKVEDSEDRVIKNNEESQ